MTSELDPLCQLRMIKMSSRPISRIVWFISKSLPGFLRSCRVLCDTLKKESGLNHPLQMLIPLQDQIVDPDISLQFFRTLN